MQFRISLLLTNLTLIYEKMELTNVKSNYVVCFFYKFK